MPNTALEHWESVSDRHAAVTEFLGWVQAEYGVVLDFSHCSPEKPVPLAYQSLIDLFFGVDRTKLDKERRVLLRKCQLRSQA